MTQSISDQLKAIHDGAAASALAARKDRLRLLRGLKSLIHDHRTALYRGLYLDLGRHPVESTLLEVDRVSAELDHALVHLTDWMEPQTVRVPLRLQPAGAKIVPQPQGPVAVLGARTLPLASALLPAISAIAAGNPVLVKIAAEAPATAAVLQRFLPEIASNEELAIVCGDAALAQQITALPWAHIYLTGSRATGQAVYAQAAQTLSRVSMHLGGACPVVVSSGNALTIARRIVYAKFANAGQSCVAPNYVLATSDGAYEALAEELPVAIEEFYGAQPERSPDYVPISRASEFERLTQLFHWGSIHYGGRSDAKNRFIQPTVMVDIDPKDERLGEEICGPILPLVRCRSQAEATAVINAHPPAPAAYFFSESHRQQRQFEQQVQAGAISHNAALVHLGVGELPHGGSTGHGFGSYQSSHGFRLFSDYRPVFTKPLSVDTLRLAYPPFSKAKRRLVRGWQSRRRGNR